LRTGANWEALVPDGVARVLWELDAVPARPALS
jgi:hypothetical protein